MLSSKQTDDDLDLAVESREIKLRGRTACSGYSIPTCMHVHGKLQSTCCFVYERMQRMQLMRRMRFGVAALEAGAVPLRPRAM